ncbi:hypothetical protein ACT3UJ_02085 [Halomonas sp. 86]|uniref:hypothetical protein n=1 Tax=unclassified Halomonas TaxID=2609666 RepID=UPI004034A740
MADTITAQCPDCGNTELSIPDNDDEQVVCAACDSEIGTKRSFLDNLDKIGKEIGDGVLGVFGASGKGIKNR